MRGFYNVSHIYSGCMGYFTIFLHKKSYYGYTQHWVSPYVLRLYFLITFARAIVIVHKLKEHGCEPDFINRILVSVLSSIRKMILQF